MRTSTFLLLTLLCGFVEPLVAADAILPPDALEVSLVQLIANPKDYDGKLVRVAGFLRLEFEGNAIYLHQDDYKHGIFKNGLWVDAREDYRKRASEFDQKYVELQGIFKANVEGHGNEWSGGIQRAYKFQVRSLRNDRK